MTVTLADRLDPWARGAPGGADVATVVLVFAAAAARLSARLARGPLAAEPEHSAGAVTGGGGDEQTSLDRFSDALFRDALAAVPAVAAYLSEEIDAPIRLHGRGSLVVAVDPLDGSGNVGGNATLGSIVSVLPATGDDPFLQPGSSQRAAALALYGPRTILVVSTGDGTDGYVLDRDRFVLAQPRMHIPASRPELAINFSNHRHWEAPVRAYADDSLAGRAGPMGVDFNTRWLGCCAAEAYRILGRGGIYLYPRDARPGCESGRLRLAYEANPLALLVEQAGGDATDGERRILDVTPRALHQRAGLVLGSSEMVETVSAYHAGGASAGARSPLFGRRGLYRV